MDTNLRQFRLAGALLGTAVGDAIGLPREGLSRRRAARLFGGPPLRHRLVFGHGMTSDDTEHTCMVAQALLASGGETRAFGRSLAWRLRFWMLGLPAGVGLGTARAIVKLWLGFPPQRSGVWSAGNGPAMRAAILGVYAANDRQKLRELVHVSTRLTHTDPAAEHGALAVALAAAYGSQQGPTSVSPDDFLAFAREDLGQTPIWPLLEDAASQVKQGRLLDEYLRGRNMEHGISGWVNHTVPAAIFCWLRWPGDFQAAVEQIVLGGGDSDTTGAIVGGLVGATAGAEKIPEAWLNGLMEWPRSTRWMRRLATALSDAVEGQHTRPLPLFWPGLLLRNIFFLIVVILHALRRLLPPY
jgi:ADP-ribosyl-[dinitrogen reductase] hydrolase